MSHSNYNSMRSCLVFASIMVIAAHFAYADQTLNSGSNRTTFIQRLPAPDNMEVRSVSEPRETLQDAWDVAYAVDQLGAARHADVSAAEFKLNQAHAAKMPNVLFDGAYSVRDNETAVLVNAPGLPLGTSAFNDSQRDGFTAYASVNLPLYTSHRLENGISAADTQLAAIQLDRFTYHRELKLSVAREYIAVLLAERELEVAASAHDALEAHLRDAIALFEFKRVPRNDLLAAQVAESNAQQQVFRIRTQLDVNRATYNRRLGRPLTSPVNLADLNLPDIDGDVEVLTALAIRQRHELKSFSLQIQSLRHRAEALRANVRPQVDLRGDYAFQENRFRSPEGIASVGIGVKWNAFDGGQSRNEASELIQRSESLSRQRADYESRIRLDVRTAWLDVRESERRISVTQQAMRRAEENLRVVRKQYALGSQTGAEVLDAVTLQIQSEQNHFNARYNRAFATLRLQNAIGDL